MKTKPHTGPWAWQRFGEHYCLTGQYGMRPIILSANPRGKLKLRDSDRDLLVDFDPNDPDARLIAAAPCLLAVLREVMQVTYPAAHSNTCVFAKTGKGCDCHLGRVQAAIAKTENC